MVGHRSFNTEHAGTWVHTCMYQQLLFEKCMHTEHAGLYTATAVN